MFPFPADHRLLVLGLCGLVLAAGQTVAEERPLRQVIDAEVQAAWKREKIAPSGRADDATFLRRVYLDLVGTIPTYDEVRAFLVEADAGKRDRVIDRLLADPRFAEHQAAVWDLVLFGRNPPNGDAVRKRGSFKKWLASKFARNEPHDRWVRDLLLAEEDGPELFYVQYRSRPEDTTEAVSRIFLGTQLQCARCHDHPYESWTQKDFYGLAGFFVRLVVFDPTGSGPTRRYRLGEKSTGEVLFSGSAKEQRPGRRGDPVKPKFLGGPVLDEPPLPAGFKEPDARSAKSLPKPAFSRKQKLAEWVVAPDNPYFARAAVNRLWGQFFGRGLIHPVDDLGGKTPPSHPTLLDELTKQFAGHKFELKWFIRELVSSQTYQLSDRGTAREAVPKWYERARVRPLSAEEILASMRTATSFDASGGKLSGGTEEYFVRYFGEPTNGLGHFQGGLSEHLFLNNSGGVRELIRRRKGNLADTLLTSTEPWEKRIDRLYLSVLGRPPTPSEQKTFAAHLTSDPKVEPLVEEAIWALVNSAEFRFNR